MNRRRHFQRALVVLLIWSTGIFAAEFRVDTLQENSVVFYAKATMGNFTGKTDRIRGFIRWENGDTVASGQVHFEVDLASFDTGVGLRNKHMREKYLETDSFPTAVYEGKITEWKFNREGVYKVKTEGTLTLHGVTRPFSAKATVFDRGEVYQVFLQFRLVITDFGIEQPRFLLASMQPKVVVQVNFYLRKTEPHPPSVGN